MKGILLALYRIRGPLYYAAAVILIGNVLVGGNASGDGARQMRLILVWVALGLAALCVMLTFLFPRSLSTLPERVVSSPVRGRWQALNSPASVVPSHGVRAYGQAYAIDLVYDPGDASRPEFGGSMMTPSREYPAFGQPVFAMIDGTVVRASDWRRDHHARSNGLGFIYMMVEGIVREMGGPGFVVGNHVVVRGDDGVYALVAHLQRGSATVRPGDRVSAGSRIGSCGNSGNSSEPHVHAQAMDRASLWTAQGVPIFFAGIRLDGAGPVDALPANEQYMDATEIPRKRIA